MVGCEEKTQVLSSCGSRDRGSIEILIIRGGLFNFRDFLVVREPCFKVFAHHLLGAFRATLHGVELVLDIILRAVRHHDGHVTPPENEKVRC